MSKFRGDNTIIKPEHESAALIAMLGFWRWSSFLCITINSLSLPRELPQFHSSLDMHPMFKLTLILLIGNYESMFWVFYFWDMTCYLICLALIVLISFLYCVLLCNHWLVSYVDPLPDPLPKLLSIWARVSIIVDRMPCHAPLQLY